MPNDKGVRQRLIPTNRLDRVLGLPRRAGRLSTGQKSALLFGGLALIALLVALFDPRPSLRHVRVAVSSGSPAGNYHATVERLGAEVARRQGRVTNLPSPGSVENVERLVRGRTDCSVHFALVQGGIPLPDAGHLELIGRLPRPEAVVVLGRSADRIARPADLHGLRIGIGPVGSGTEHLARRLLAPLDELRLILSTQARANPFCASGPRRVSIRSSPKNGSPSKPNVGTPQWPITGGSA
jgi:hypothetical protein